MMVIARAAAPQLLPKSPDRILFSTPAEESLDLRYIDRIFDRYSAFRVRAVIQIIRVPYPATSQAVSYVEWLWLFIPSFVENLSQELQLFLKMRSKYPLKVQQ